MNQTDYVQTRCQRCGQPTWGHVTQTIACSACGQPVAPLASSPWNPASPYGTAQPPGAQAFQTPGPAVGTQPGVPSQAGGPSVNVQMPFGMKIPIKLPGGGAGKAKVGAAVVGVAALAVGGAVLKSKLKGEKARPNTISYSSLKMDVKHIDADLMAPAVEGQARAWQKDAAYFGINLQAVHGDGTLDATGGGAVVKYISLDRAKSALKDKREDSIKSFAFGPSGVDYSGGNMVEGFEHALPDDTQAPPVPRCGIKNVLKQVKGLTGDKTVRITYDPQDKFAWRVMGEDPKIDAYFSIDDCSPVVDK